MPFRFHAGLLALLATAASLVWAAESAPSKSDSRTIVIAGGTLRTQTDAGDFVGTIVIRDGKITMLGREVEPPEGAEKIDATGCIITPGLIDAHGSLGMHSTAAKESGRDASLDALDGIDPYASDWRDAAKQGVTAVYVQPSGSLGGVGAVLAVRAAATVPELAINPQAALQASLGVSSESAAAAANPQLAALMAQLGIQQPTPTAAPPATSNTVTRFAQYESLRLQFDVAKKYAESKPAKPDRIKDQMARAVRGEIPVRMEIGHEDDLRNAIQLAHDFKLRAVYEHVERAKPIPEEFAARKADLVIGPLWGTANTPELRRLALDGRRFAIGTFNDDPRATSWLRYHAAAAVADNYPKERVLRAMTREAAQILGAADKLGRLAVGRVADLAVFAGDPLDPAVRVRLTISQGVVTHEQLDAEVAAPVTSAKPTLPAKLPPRYVIRTTRLMTQNGEFMPGELIVENGAISSRSPGGDDPPVFDLGDAPVTPGFVAGHVTTVSEATPDSDAGHLRAVDGVSPKDARLKSLRGAGFLSSVVAPGSSNVIAGIASVIAGPDGSAAVDCGVKIVFGAAARDSNRFPQSLYGQIDFIDARLHGRESHSDLFLSDAVAKAMLSSRDTALAAVRDGKAVAWCDAQTPAEIRAALRIIREHKLRGILLGPDQFDDLAEQIRAADVPVVVTTLNWLDSEKDVRELVALANANVSIAFGGDAKEMRASAARLVNLGLPRAAARRGLIAQPASKFGLPAGCGRIAAGDMADFVIWTGDPVDVGTQPFAVIAHGQRLGGS